MGILLAAPAPCQAQEKRPWQKRWWVSVALIAAASVADLHSSQGLSEANPLLRNQRSGMDMAKGAWIKSATAGGVRDAETMKEQALRSLAGGTRRRSR